MEGQILPPESLTNEAIAERLSSTALKSIEEKDGKEKKPHLLRVEWLFGKYHFLAEWTESGL